MFNRQQDQSLLCLLRLLCLLLFLFCWWYCRFTAVVVFHVVVDIAVVAWHRTKNIVPHFFSFRLLFGMERTIGRKYDLPKLFFLLNLNGTPNSTHSPLSTLPASPAVKIARVNTQMVEKSLTWNQANLIFDRISSTSFVRCCVFLKKCLPRNFFLSSK